MIDKLDEFLAVIAHAGVDLAMDEARDALWLSTHINVVTQDDLARDRPASTVSQPPEALPPKQSAPPASRGETADDTPGHSASPLTELYAAGGGSARTMHGMVARSPAVAALPHKAALSRALRPLKRTRPSATKFEVDENATADQIAADDLWVPVLRPTAEKWLDLTLVVDTAPSMIIWRQTLAEFRTLAERLGAFRRIRVVELDGDATQNPAVTPEAAAVATQPNPATLIDPAERQAILVVTDGVGRAWRDGLMQPYLRQWAQHGSVAIATVLPRRMWSGAGLKVTAGQAWTPRPGAPNKQWTTRGSLHIPIPVVGLSEHWLTPWAQLVAGAGGSHRTALLADHRPLVGHERRRAPPALPTELVDAFRAAASPTGFRLACYLSAAWLNLPVMRLVQQLMLPDSDPSHLAEVFLGGLLHRVGTDHDGEPETAQYEFKPGVRDQLNDYLSREELLTVLQRSTEFVADRFGQSFNFAALLADPDGVDLPAVVGDSGGRPLALVSASVLARLGGRYQSLADRLTARGPAASVAPNDGYAPDVSSSAAPLTPAPTVEDAARTRSIDGFFLGVADTPDPRVFDARRFVERLWPSFGSEILSNPTGAEVEDSLQQLSDNVPTDGVLVVLWSSHTTSAKDGAVQLVMSDNASQTFLMPLQRVVDACVRAQASQVLIILEGCQGQSIKGFEPPDGPGGFGILALPRTPDRPIAGFLADLLSTATRDWPASRQTLRGWELGEWIVDKAREQGKGHDAYFVWKGAGSAEIIANPAFTSAAEKAQRSAVYSVDSVRDLARAGDFVLAEVIAEGIADPDQRSQALGALSQALAQAEDIGRAVELAKQIPALSSRALTMASIATEAAARLGDLQSAARLIRDAEDVAKSITGSDRSEVAAALAKAQEFILAPAPSLVGTRLFISFTNTDRFQASRLCTLLAEAGAHVVMDPESADRPRKRSPNWIEGERDRADVILVIIPRGNGRWSRLFDTELELISRRRSTPVIPVVQPAGSNDHYLEWVQSFADNPTQVLGDLSQASIRSLVIGIAYAAEREQVSSVAHRAPEDQQDLYDRAAAGDSDAMFELGVLNAEQLEPPDLDASRRWYERAAAAGNSEATFNLKALDAERLSDNLTVLADQRRFRDALALVTEAIELYRELAGARPDKYRKGLAVSLYNQSSWLVHMLDYEHALAAISEAVDLYRELDADDPHGFGPTLARALSTQGTAFVGVGRNDDALAANSEAVALYRELDADDPHGFGPNLAGALSGQSSLLEALGRNDDALAANSEAVALYRELDADDPHAFGPNLAGALSDQSSLLEALGRNDDALAANSEAVALYRELAAAGQHAVRLDLARALSSLSAGFTSVGRGEEALVAINEAIDLWRELAAADPRYREDLAASLRYVRSQHAQVGDHRAAVSASREAVSIYAALVHSDPERYRDSVDEAVSNLAIDLRGLGRTEQEIADELEALPLPGPS